VEPLYKFGDFGVLALGVRECRGKVVTELTKKKVVCLPGIYTVVYRRMETLALLLIPI
jgi:hypothetical protein